MRYKLTFGAGLTAGYLLGSKAGRSRYDEIMRKLRGLSEDPTVQETAGVVQAKAADLTQTAKRLVTDTVESVSGKVGGRPADSPATTDSVTDLTVTDLTTPAKVGSGSSAGGPVPGAAPSGSAPIPGTPSGR